MDHCPKCKSTKLVHDAIVCDKGRGSSGVAQVAVEANPKGWIFTDPVFCDLRAHVCGDCGYTEFYVSHPSYLYHAFLDAQQIEGQARENVAVGPEEVDAKVSEQKMEHSLIENDDDATQEKDASISARASEEKFTWNALQSPSEMSEPQTATDEQSMDLKKPVVAYIAESNLESHLIVTMLENNGIPAYAVEDQSGASLWMFGAISQFHKPKIYVEETDFEKATGLIQSYAEKERERQRLQRTDLSIDVVCEACGKTSRFPESQRATVQDCPHCGEYVDVGPPAWSLDPETFQDRHETHES